MTRYLTAEWFAEAGASDRPDPDAEMVLEQVVDGTPDGEVVYRVEVHRESSRLLWPVAPESPTADLRLRCDWETAVAIAQGEVSTQRALMDGRIRVSGDTRRLAKVRSDLAELDPVPPPVRRATTYASD
jgi:hypothetical protein